MANELYLTGNLSYSDSEGSSDFLQVLAKQASVAAKKYTKGKVSVGTSEEALPLGEVTAPGWALVVNRDATNYVELKTGAAGVVFAKLLPGEFALLRLGSGAQSPYAQANTAACQLEFLIAQT